MTTNGMYEQMPTHTHCVVMCQVRNIDKLMNNLSMDLLIWGDSCNFLSRQVPKTGCSGPTSSTPGFEPASKTTDVYNTFANFSLGSRALHDIQSQWSWCTANEAFLTFKDVVFKALEWSNFKGSAPAQFTFWSPPLVWQPLVSLLVFVFGLLPFSFASLV